MQTKRSDSVFQLGIAASEGTHAVNQPRNSNQTGLGPYVDRFFEAWRNPQALSLGWLLFTFFSGLAVICTVTVFIGAVPTRIYGHDIFVSLDGGWRVINGQRPHLDFMSPWGPVWFLVEALGLTLSHHSVDGVGYANAIVAFVIGTWSFLVGNDRLASLPRILLGWFLAALVAAPYPLGVRSVFPSHAMTYNRYGYALIGLILLECVTQLRGSGNNLKAEWIGGLSTGVALGLTLFLKASYFFVGVGLTAALAVLLGALAWRRLAAIALGFALISTCILAYLRFNVAAVLGDLRMAGAARSAALHRSVFLASATHRSQLFVLALFVLGGTLLFDGRNTRWRGWKLLAVVVLVFSADVGLMSTNAQYRGFPLCAVIAILILNEIGRDQPPQLAAKGMRFHLRSAVILCLGALLCIPQFASDLAGLFYGLRSKQRLSTENTVPRFASQNLKPLVLYDFPTAPQSNGHTFVEYVNDGIALLRRESRASETIITIDMTNPFSYALERPPARAGIESPTYNFNIDDAHKPSDERFFGDADLVMVPKRPALDPYFFLGLYKAYEPGLKERYYLAAESPLWWMYRRK